MKVEQKFYCSVLLSLDKKFHTVNRTRQRVNETQSRRQNRRVNDNVYDFPFSYLIISFKFQLYLFNNEHITKQNKTKKTISCLVVLCYNYCCLESRVKCLEKN